MHIGMCPTKAVLRYYGHAILVFYVILQVISEMHFAIQLKINQKFRLTVSEYDDPSLHFPLSLKPLIFSLKFTRS